MLVGAGALVGVLTGTASAGSIDLNRATIDTGSTSVTAVCNTTPADVSGVRSTFTAPTTYEVRRVTVRMVPNTCRSRPYTLTVAADASPFTALGSWSATMPSGPNGNLDGSPGADVNDIGSTNQLRAYVVVSTS